jgi:heptosyltransferase-2
MELSCRKLLLGQGLRLDLLTLPKLAPLFLEDEVFQRVHTDPTAVNPDDYDVVLLQEYNHPSLRLLQRHFRQLPYACLFRYFYGPARNQTSFGFHAANRLFGLGLSPSEVDLCCAPYLTVSAATRESVREFLPSNPFVALALGGIDPRRTYSRWAEVLAAAGQMHLSEGRAPLNVVLLGSDNGVAMQEHLLAAPPAGIHLTPLVGRLAILQSQAVAGLAAAFVGCDGGLMHLAHSSGVPSVTIFAAGEPPAMFLSPAYPSEPLYSTDSADQISPEAIVSALIRIRDAHQDRWDNSANSSA